MGVAVASRIGHALSRLVAGSSFAGEGILIRLRSSTIGLLGVIAAVGLGLVGFVSQQGWPEVFSGPLPVGPSRVVQNDTIALGGEPAAQRSATLAGSARHAAATPARAESVPETGSDPQLTGSRPVGVPSDGAGAPAKPPAPQPQPAPVTPPSPATPVAAAPPAASEPGPTLVDTESPSNSPGQSGATPDSPEAPPGQSSDPPNPPPAEHGGHWHDGDYDHGYDGHGDDGDYYGGHDFDDHGGHGRPDWAGH